MPIENEVEVLLLQHPLETGNAKNSARLLHLNLPHSMLAVGEAFTEQDLRTLLYAPFPSASAFVSDLQEYEIQPVLLYPGEANNIPFQANATSPSIRHRLIVLDGTWRKSRKMLHLNPLLQDLPRLALRNPPASHYDAIRKAHRPDQLSTFEAVCHALTQLENEPEKYQPLLAAFDGFVAQQQSYAVADATLHSSL
jgi:DTW domain-containing protein YfiP